MGKEGPEDTYRVRLRKDILIVVDQRNGHADGCAWRNGVRIVLHCAVWEDTRKTMGDSVEHAKALVHDGH